MTCVWLSWPGEDDDVRFCAAYASCEPPRTLSSVPPDAWRFHGMRPTSDGVVSVASTHGHGHPSASKKNTAVGGGVTGSDEPGPVATHASSCTYGSARSVYAMDALQVSDAAFVLRYVTCGDGTLAAHDVSSPT